MITQINPQIANVICDFNNLPLSLFSKLLKGINETKLNIEKFNSFTKYILLNLYSPVEIWKRKFP
jgi:hypothetical protein